MSETVDRNLRGDRVRNPQVSVADQVARGAAFKAQRDLAEFIADLNSASGSTLFKFLQAGVGAVARTGQDKLRDWLSPKDFGAVGDGITNDTDAFIKAITYATASGKGLDLNYQTYVLNASDEATHPDFAVDSLAIRNGHLLFTGEGNAFVADGSATVAGHVSGLRLENLIIEGDSADIVDGMSLFVVVRSSIHNIEVRNVTGKSFHIKHGVSNHYDGLKVTNNDYTPDRTPTDGLYIDEDAPGEYTADCLFSNAVMEGFTGTGCNIIKASGCAFVGGTFEGITGTGLIVNEGCRHNIFDSIWFEVNSVADIELRGELCQLRNLYCGSAGSDRNVQLYGNGNSFIGGSLRAVEQQGTPVANRFFGCAVSSEGSLGFVGTEAYERIGCVTVDNNQDVNGVLPDIVQSVQWLTFPSTQIPSNNANTLDDYEEGTFTPVLTATAGVINPNAAFTGGTYTKIGNLVTVCITCYVTSVGTDTDAPSGELSITGLPFALKAGNAEQRAAAVAFFGMGAGATGAPMGFAAAGGTSITLRTYSAGGSSQIAAYVQADTDIRVTLQYQV